MRSRVPLRAFAVLIALLVAAASHAASDEQKKHAFDTVDRNAQAIAT